MAEETLKNMKEKANQRKSVALSYNIPKKAKLLTEVLGEPYHSSHNFYGGDFAGDFSSSNQGYEFKGKNVRILSYIKTYLDPIEKHQVTEIYVQPQGLLKSLIHGFSERVYHQQDKEVEVFKEMHKWVDRIDSLYEFAIKNKRTIKFLEKEEESNKKIDELKENFGLF